MRTREGRDIHREQCSVCGIRHALSALTGKVRHHTHNTEVCPGSGLAPAKRERKVA